MSDKKPKVIPDKEDVKKIKEEENSSSPKLTDDMINAANDTGAKMAEQFEKENSDVINEASPKITKLTQEMINKSMEEKKRVESGEKIVRPELAVEGTQVKGEQLPKNDDNVEEEDPILASLSEKQKAERVEALKRRSQMEQKIENNMNNSGDEPPTPPSEPTINDMGDNNPESNKYSNLSKPQTNVAYDLIPLPSDGKVYPSKKKALKVAYMTAADENILTNPNLLESGDFLEILINRKLLDEDIRYKDLHVGDRNAIMLWLRSTAYGEIYPITMFDRKGEKFDVDVDLNQLKTIPLGAEPDANGYFDYTLPVSKINIKFKLLSVGEVDDIESHVEYVKENLGDEYVDSVTYSLEKQIVSVNDNSDPTYIKNFIQTMRLGDSRAFKKYVDEIESGVDLSIEVRSPGGETINTFLPLNLRFFWPDL